MHPRDTSLGSVACMPSLLGLHPADLAALALPECCGGCGDALPPGRDRCGLRAWCAHCADRCGPLAGPWRAVDGSCPGWAAALYSGRVRRAVLAAKRGAPAAAAELLLARWPAAIEVDGLVVTWIPAHPRRAIAGPDAGRVLAHAVGEELGAPVERLLWRTPWSRRQAGRDDASRRRAPQRLGLRAVGRAPERVLLVDDVRTTGTTLDQAASLLRAAGAREVSAVTVAIAPPRPGE